MNVNNYPGGSTSVKKYICAFELGDLTFPNGYDCITFYTWNTSLWDDAYRGKFSKYLHSITPRALLCSWAQFNSLYVCILHFEKTSKICTKCKMFVDIYIYKMYFYILYITDIYLCFHVCVCMFMCISIYVCMCIKFVCKCMFSGYSK